MNGHGKCTAQQNNGYICHQDAVFTVESQQVCAQHVAKALHAAFALDDTMEAERYAAVYRNNVLGVAVRRFKREQAQS